MILKPILTEKSLKDAKNNKYTFLVDRRMAKGEIKNLVAKVFNTKVTSIATINVHGENKVTMRGVRKSIKPTKKAIVTTVEKIEIFEETKK
jgi:large subunit ribosomal protein L23